jgi:hypothetical protein
MNQYQQHQYDAVERQAKAQQQQIVRQVKRENEARRRRQS